MIFTDMLQFIKSHFTEKETAVKNTSFYCETETLWAISNTLKNETFFILFHMFDTLTRNHSAERFLVLYFLPE